MRSKLYEKFQAIQSSKGMGYVNRSYARSFTRNIFDGNSEELLKLLRKLKNPEIYLESLRSGALEPEHRVFRDVVRAFHNFLCGAMTLVDHTRVFVSEFYLGTEVNKQFKSRIDRDFKENVLARFVQDLRNYMVHRGLPPLHRHITFKQIRDEAPGKVTITTGFQLSAEKLKEWNGWKADSKKFLASSHEVIDLLEVVETYLAMINRFHDEFDELLRSHHKADLEELAEMQAEFQAQQASGAGHGR